MEDIFNADAASAMFCATKPAVAWDICWNKPGLERKKGGVRVVSTVKRIIMAAACMTPDETSDRESLPPRACSRFFSGRYFQAPFSVRT